MNYTLKIIEGLDFMGKQGQTTLRRVYVEIIDNESQHQFGVSGNAVDPSDLMTSLAGAITETSSAILRWEGRHTPQSKTELKQSSEALRKENGKLYACH